MEQWEHRNIERCMDCYGVRFGMFSGRSCGSMPPMKASPRPIVTGVSTCDKSLQGKQRNDCEGKYWQIVLQKVRAFSEA